MVGLFGRRADAAREAIARAEAVLDVLRLSKVDLSPAATLIDQAKGAAEEKRYPEAEALAGRAESLAGSLEERYRAAQRALRAVRAMGKRVRELGLDAAGFDRAVEAARKAARQGTVEDGVTIPNYLQARATLEVELNRGRALLQSAEAVANDVFTAEVALDALRDANGHIDEGEFERVVVSGARQALEQAKARFAAGDFSGARAAAQDAEARAKQARIDYEDALGALRDAERTLADLRAEGAVFPGAERLVEQGTAHLKRAKLAEAREVLVRADADAQRIAGEYRRAAKAVEAAEAEVSAMARAGPVSEDAERAAQEARRAVNEGRYARAEEFALESGRAVGRRREIRDRLARSIEEVKAKVEALREMGADYANDVEEMVLRAEREFENGDFVNSSEDLKIATLLMGPADRNPGKGRPAQGGA